MGGKSDFEEQPRATTLMNPSRETTVLGGIDTIGTTLCPPNTVMVANLPEVLNLDAHFRAAQPKPPMGAA